MNVIKIAAFSDGNSGGNPAGVVLLKDMPSSNEMRKIATDVGFSETVFAIRQEGNNSWRVRYFSPESEVPFCGHATIALGAALANANGDGNYQLTLNSTTISVEGVRQKDGFNAALQSPSTHYELIDKVEIEKTLKLFGYTSNQLSEKIIPARIHGGSDHYVIVLKSRKDLSSMEYSLSAGREFMNERGLVTVMFAVPENDQLFHVRNAFASGGVLEDPATGAAAAAFSGYLRDTAWPNNGEIKFIQGEDMGARSLIITDSGSVTRGSVRVSGTTRNLS
jgi:PhzF family phenazine biosynthesis protein